MRFIKFPDFFFLPGFFFLLLNHELQFVIFCFWIAAGFRSQKNFFSRIALKLFLGAFHQISRTFFFCPVLFFLLLNHELQFVIFCFRIARRVSLTQKNFFVRIALKIFLGAFQQISRLFFFLPGFVFFLSLLFRLFYGRFRVLSSSISSETVKVAKILKIYSETPWFGPPNRQVSFL